MKNQAGSGLSLKNLKHNQYLCYEVCISIFKQSKQTQVKQINTPRHTPPYHYIYFPRIWKVQDFFLLFFIQLFSLNCGTPCQKLVWLPKNRFGHRFLQNKLKKKITESFKDKYIPQKPIRRLPEERKAFWGSNTHFFALSL